MNKEALPGPKKKWARPLLTILIRGKPEEGALLPCKIGGLGSDAGPALVAAACLVSVAIPPWCGMCSAWAST